MTRVVFDCMVLLQGAGNAAGPSGACLAAVEAGRVELVTSADVLAEVGDVIRRPKIRVKFARVTDAGVELFLDRVRRSAVLIPDVPAVVSLPRDPKDAKYFDLAVAAGAGFILSWDHAVLATTDPACDAPDAVAFRADHPGIVALTPPAFLALLPSLP